MVALIAAAVGAFFALDLGRFLSWESLLAHRAALQGESGGTRFGRCWSTSSSTWP
jgi:hypothetical protein